MSNAERVAAMEQQPHEIKAGAMATETPKNDRTADTGWQEQPANGRLAARNAQGNAAQQSEGHASGIQRTVGAIRTLIPLVQKVLPLLDGNVALALANLLAPRLPAPPVDLQPVESTLAKIRAEVVELRIEMTTHDSALKRIEQQIDSVNDSLERSAVTQNEMIENLHRMRKRITTLTVVGVLLIVFLIGADALLMIRLGRVLP